MLLRPFIASLLILFASNAALAEQLRVASAASFRPTLEKITKAWHTRTGVKSLVSSASTGVLFTQISHGAAYDVILAADQKHVAQLSQAGLVTSDSVFTYAQGVLVLTSHKPLAEDPRDIKIQLAQKPARIAVANAELAPFGIAAQSALAKLGLSNKPQRITAQNAGQAFQFFTSGNTDFALVSLAQWRNWRGAGNATYWTVPQDYYAPVLQDAAILKASPNPVGAADFLAFLRSPAVRHLLNADGYALPATYASQATTESYP